MTGNRKLIHSIFLFLLPVIVAHWGFSTGCAIMLVIVTLLWHWAITLSGIIKPVQVPELELETISASHYVEKVRWCMDRLGVDYIEKPMAGTLGVFFTGRSVPQLKVRTALVRSVLGNSSDILRYLWGRYAVERGEQADFLEPTARRLELETGLDRYGRDLQVWIYYHILPDRQLTLHAWGYNNSAIPAWQRLALSVLFPVLRYLIRRSFQISDGHKAKAVEHIESTLADINQRLSDGRQSILGGQDIDYVDITFAALSGLWLQPPAYGAGMSDAVRVDHHRLNSSAQSEIERWKTSYPHAIGFVEDLYLNDRT